MGLLNVHLAGVEASVDERGEAVALEELLVKRPWPVGVREQTDEQAAVAQRPQGRRGLRVVADVGRPAVEVPHGRLL
jgi:hypothetical protein